jgi:hypothetical protein
MTHRQPPYSANTLRRSERFQSLTGAVGRAATWLVAGSSSPAYLQLYWRTVGQEVIGPDKFIKLPGNSHARLLMRQWNTAYLLSMDDLELETINREHPGSQPAVALRHDGFVQLGTHPDMHFGAIGDGDLRAVAGREGRGPVEVSAGLYSEEAGRMVIPTSLREKGAHLPLALFEIPPMQDIRVV